MGQFDVHSKLVLRMTTPQSANRITLLELRHPVCTYLYVFFVLYFNLRKAVSCISSPSLFIELLIKPTKLEEMRPHDPKFSASAKEAAAEALLMHMLSSAVLGAIKPYLEMTPTILHT